MIFDSESFKGNHKPKFNVMIKILTNFKKHIDAFSKPNFQPGKVKLRGLAFSLIAMFALTFAGVSNANAQNEITVTGVVMDAASSETLPVPLRILMVVIP